LVSINEIGIERAASKLKTETMVMITEKTVRFIIGFTLFVGSRGLVGILRKIREAGKKMKK